MTQHINPGTDTTINPVVIDDSYRERKQKTPYAKDLKAIEDYIYSTMNHTPEWEKAEQAYQNILSSHTPAHPPEAQQRIDEAIAYCNQRHFEVEDDDGTIYEAIPKGEIIALLQAGDHHE